MDNRELDKYFDMGKLKDIPKLDLTWDKTEHGGRRMEGTIARILTQKSFGFVRGEDKRDYFFHSTDLNGFWDDLVADYESGRIIKVTFQSVPSQKGLRAGGVTRTDMGI